MIELRFKLKKAGQTVGYMRIGYSIRPDRLDCQWRYADGDGHWNLGTPDIGFCDSAHPFVCRDRNGRDVYCDDWVLFRLDNDEPGERTQITVGDKWTGFQVLYRTLRLMFKSEDIELLEDQPAQGFLVGGCPEYRES